MAMHALHQRTSEPISFRVRSSFFNRLPMPLLILMVVAVVALGGCKDVNSAYCPSHPDVEGCLETGSSGGHCKTSADCPNKPNFPDCETMPGLHVNTCVQCTANEHALCTGTTPICKDDSCAACTIDSDCGTGGLCLPNGACAVSASIIHASTGGSTTPPCGSTSIPCSFTTALATVDSTRNVIKLDDAGPYIANGSSSNYIVNANVTIDARNATLHHFLDGPIVTIGSNKTVVIFGGKIEGATNGEGIQCSSNATLTVDGTTIEMNEKSAITTAPGCKLSVTNAIINSNSLRAGQYIGAILASGDSAILSRSRLMSNKGGGIAVTSGTFVIIGNVFQSNGDVNNPNAAVTILTGFDAMNRLELNSISGNLAQSGATPGVQCSAGIGFVARNNIIWGNNGNVGAQVGANCQHAYSDIGMLSVTGSNDAGNNLNVDPLFTSDLHLMPFSPLIKKADPNADLNGVATKDIDGDPRVAPADIGADQLPRP